MLDNSPARLHNPALSELRQVKAMLRLVEDLGYDVEVGTDGEWTVTARNEPADRTVVGVDSAREVAAAARKLAEALLIDRVVAPVAAH